MVARLTKPPSSIEREIVRQSREAFRVKDDWPQALMMSMGTVFLLAGLGTEIAKFSAVLDKYKNGEDGGKREIETPTAFAATRPGLLHLSVGVALMLVGYLVPRLRTGAPVHADHTQRNG